MEKAQLKRAHHNATVIGGVPAGEGGNCPVPRRVDSNSDETKRTEYQGTLSGKIGLELEERDRVEVTDLRIEGSRQTINFGDPRVVNALTPPGDCTVARDSTTLLEIPFEITKTGTVAVDMTAFTEVIARMRGVGVDQGDFGTNAPQPPANPNPNPPAAPQPNPQPVTVRPPKQQEPRA